MNAAISQKIRNWPRIISLVGVVGLMGYIGIATYPYWSSLFASTPQTFSEEDWRDANRFRRRVMAQDFLNRYANVAMNKDQVTNLLGEPDIRDPNGFHYVVALTAGDYILLTFHVDSDGRILKADLHQS